MKTRVITAITAAALAGLTAFAWAEETFAPPKISAWDGNTWGALRFGQTTQDGIKQEFKDGRGEFRNSVELKLQPEPAYKINALFPNLDKNAKLHGLIIRYKNDTSDGVPIDDLSRALMDEEAETRYPSLRHEDWRVVTYPKRGILAFVINDKATWILLGKPDKVASAFASLAASEPTTVVPVPDPGEGKEKEIVYGDVDVTFDLTRISLNRKDRERDLLESDLRRAGDGRGRTPLRYESGATGGYSVSISARSHDDKAGDGSVSARIWGTTPYGKVDVSSYETFRVDKGRSRLEDTSYERAVTRAQRSVEEKALTALNAQGPPTIEAVRRDQWTQIVEQYRLAKAGSSGGLL